MAQKPKFLNESRKQNWNFLRDKGEGVEGRGRGQREGGRGEGGKGSNQKKKPYGYFPEQPSKIYMSVLTVSTCFNH